MFLPSHIASGYIVSKILPKKKSNLKHLKMMVPLIILGSVLPDSDYLFSHTIKDHHFTLLHAPFFWLVIFILIFMFGWIIRSTKLKTRVIAFTIGALSHLFLDWFSGRTAGIWIFYPFSKRVYSLFPLTPEKGEISVWPNERYVEFWKFYAENKFLLYTELLIIILAAAILIVSIKTINYKKN